MFGRSHSVESKELFAVANDTERFSIQNLRKLHQQLVANKSVNKDNENIVIEILRLSSEMVVYGDNNSELLFDFFCEKNMMSLFLEIMWTEGGCPVKVHVQILQTLSILVGCVRNDTSLYYLLSNNYINEIIIFPHEFVDGDCESESLRDQYISFLKSLSLKLNCLTVQFFFIEKTGAFPLLSRAIDLLAVEEPMVRAGAQTVILNVLRVKDSRAREYALQDEVVLKLFSQVVNIMEGQYMAIHSLILQYNAVNASIAAYDGAKGAAAAAGNVGNITGVGNNGNVVGSAPSSEKSNHGNNSMRRGSLGAVRGASITTDPELFLVAQAMPAAQPSFLRKISSGNKEEKQLAQLRQQLEKIEGQVTDLMISVEDWLLYLQDLLGLKIMRLRRTLVHHLVTEFIYPVLLEPFLRPSAWATPAGDDNSELGSSHGWSGTQEDSSNHSTGSDDLRTRVDTSESQCGTASASAANTANTHGDSNDGNSSSSAASQPSTPVPPANDITSPSSSSSSSSAGKKSKSSRPPQDVPRTPVTANRRLLPAHMKLVYFMTPHRLVGRPSVAKGATEDSSSFGSEPTTPMTVKSKEQEKLEREESKASVVVSLAYLSKFLRIISDKMVVRAVFMAVLHPLSRKGRKKVLHELMTGSTTGLLAAAGGAATDHSGPDSGSESATPLSPSTAATGGGGNGSESEASRSATTATAATPASLPLKKKSAEESAATAAEVLLSFFLTEYSNPYRAGFLQLFSSGSEQFALLGTMVLHSLSRGLILSLSSSKVSPTSSVSATPRFLHDSGVVDPQMKSRGKDDTIWRESGDCSADDASSSSFYSANGSSCSIATPIRNRSLSAESPVNEPLLATLSGVNMLVSLQAAAVWPDGFTPMSIADAMRQFPMNTAMSQRGSLAPADGPGTGIGSRPTSTSISRSSRSLAKTKQKGDRDFGIDDDDFEVDDVESIEAEQGLYALEPDVMSVFKLVTIDAFVRRIAKAPPKNEEGAILSTSTVTSPDPNKEPKNGDRDDGNNGTEQQQPAIGSPTTPVGQSTSADSSSATDEEGSPLRLQVPERTEAVHMHSNNLHTDSTADFKDAVETPTSPNSSAVPTASLFSLSASAASSMAAAVAIAAATMANVYMGDPLGLSRGSSINKDDYVQSRDWRSIYDTDMLWPSIVAFLIDTLADTSCHSRQTTTHIQMAAHTVYAFARIAHSAAKELDDAYAARQLKLTAVDGVSEVSGVEALQADKTPRVTAVPNGREARSPFRSSLLWCAEAVHEAFLKTATALLDRINGGGDERVQTHAETRAHSELILDILQEELLRLPGGPGSAMRWRDFSEKMNGHVHAIFPQVSPTMPSGAAGSGSLRAADLEHFVPISQSEICRREVQQFLLLRCLDLQMEKLANDATPPSESIEDFNIASLEDPTLDLFLPTIVSTFPAGSPFDMRGKRFLDAYPLQDALSPSTSGGDIRSPSPPSSSSLLPSSFLSFNLFGSGSGSGSGSVGGGGDETPGSLHGAATSSGRSGESSGKRRLKLSVIPTVPATERSPARSGGGGVGVADMFPVATASPASTPGRRGRPADSSRSANKGTTGTASSDDNPSVGIPPKIVKPSRSKKYGDVLFVQDESNLIVVVPNRLKGAAAGFNIWISAPLIYTDCAIVSTDRRELRIFVRSWDADVRNMERLLPSFSDSDNSSSTRKPPGDDDIDPLYGGIEGSPYPLGISMSIPSAVTPGDRVCGTPPLPSFLRPRHEVQGALWQTCIAFESERSCTLAAQHIENSRIKALRERVLRLKSVLNSYVGAGSYN